MNQPAPQLVPLNCPACGKAYQAELQVVVLPDSPALEALREGELNQVSCPHCGEGGILSVPFVLFQLAEARVVVFAPQFQQMSQPQQQQLVGQLVNLLKEAAGEELSALGEQLEIGIVGQYEAMVEIARGESDEGKEDEEGASGDEIDPEIRARLELLMQLMQADPVQKVALKAQNRAMLPELAQIARLLADQQTEPLVGMLHKLAQELEASSNVAGPAAEPSLVTNRKDFVVKPITTASATDEKETDSQPEPSKEMELAQPVRRRQEVLPPEPLHRPAPAMPRLLRLSVAGGKVRLTDQTTSTVTEADFNLPSLEEISRVREMMTKARLESKAEVDELLKLGQLLYNRLLPGDIGKAFEASWNEGEPLQLHLELAEPLVQFIPWEYLANAEDFLARQPNFYLSREAKVGRIKPKATELTLPLRLLLVVSSPLDLPPHKQLDADREIVLIRRGVQEPLDKGELEIELEDVASLDKLREALDTFKPHLVHFTGHGYIEADDKGNLTGSGLIMEDGAGHQRQVGAKELAGVLANRPELRAVLLSACVTALPDTDKAITNTANTLVQAGIGAVIAMQESVRDDTATRFAQYFYPALAQGRQVSEALALARQRIAEMEGGASDWGMPVLLTGQPALPLFHFTRQGQARPRALVNGTSLSVLRQGEGYFVGRQAELRAVREGLTGNREKLVLISGLGGFGKSTLAQRSIERFQTRFEVIQIISCKNWQGLISAVSEIARGLASAGFERLQQLLADQKRQFGPEELGTETAQALNEAKGLLVLDNFEDLLDWHKAEAPAANEAIRLKDSQIAEWLESLVLNLAEGRALVTSRYDFSFTRTDRYQSAIGRVQLHTLGPIEALRLMREYPELKKLPGEELLELYRSGIDNPQIIEWAEAGRRQQGGVARQKELLALHGKFSAEMLLEELYASLPELAQAVLRRSAVYREPLPLEFLSKQQAGASKALQLLSYRNLLRVLNGVDEEGQPRTLYSQHQSVRYFGLEKLETVEGEAGVQAAHQRAGQHYEYYADYLSRNLPDYISAKEHYVEGGALGEAVRLVRAINPILTRQGYWREALELNQDLNRRWQALSETENKNETEGAGLGGLDPVSRADLLMREAMNRADLGEVQAAISLYEQALEVIRLTDNRQVEGAILGNLGNAYDSLGQYDKAIAFLQKTLAIALQIGDKQGEGNAYGNLGNAYDSLGQYDKAIAFQQKRLAIALQIGDKQGEGNAYGNLGNAYTSLGQYDKAIAFLQKTLAIALQIGDKQGEGNAYGNLGLAYFSLRQ